MQFCRDPCDVRHLWSKFVTIFFNISVLHLYISILELCLIFFTRGSKGKLHEMGLGEQEDRAGAYAVFKTAEHLALVSRGDVLVFATLLPRIVEYPSQDFG